MNRICPDDMFALAHNGLSTFLTEYPHMNEEQMDKIRQLIDNFSKPEIFRKKVRRPALLCRTGQDGAILITPKTLITAKISTIVDPIQNKP